MAKLNGDRRQKNFFRVVSVTLLLCCAILLVYPEQGREEKQAEEVNSTPAEQVISTAKPDNMIVTDEPEAVESISNNVQNVKVKGIYVTGPVAGSSKKMNELVKLVETTKLNAMVIDIKNDSGEITYKMDYDVANTIGSTKNYIKDIKTLVQDLKAKDIYLIARIVTFKDPILAEKIPDYSIKNTDGSIFRDNQGLAWVNPYKREVWKYVLNVASRAADLGFDEIQFDYIRFPTAPNMKNVTYGAEEKLVSKQDLITQFTQCAANFLRSRGVKVSADVFGGIISSEQDSSIIGQDYARMSESLDSICPMVYPSQFANGCYGVENPDASPYEIVYRAMKDSQTKLSKNPNVVVRPWLQDFTATWLDNHVTYDAAKIRTQIEAVYASGYDEWILWNASNNYSAGGID